MKNKSALILEVGEKSIKACRVDILKRSLEQIEAFEFPGKPSSENIEAVFNKFKRIKSEEIIISLCRSSFLMKYIELPSSGAKDVERMLSFQLEKEAFYVPEDVTYGYSAVQERKNYTKALVFIVQKKRILNILNFIKKSGINPSAITITSGGLYNWLVLQSEFSTAPRAVLINIGKDTAELIAAGKQGLIFSREFSYSDEKGILKGVNQSFEIFKEDFPEHKVDKVFFTGIKKEAALKAVGRTETVFIDSLDKFVLSRDTRSKPELDKFSFVSILGHSRARELFKLDFSPEFLKKKRETAERRKRRFKTFLIGAQIALLCGIFVFKHVADKHFYLKYLDFRLKEVKGQTMELGKLAGKIKTLTEDFNRGGLFSEVLYGLVSSLPEGARITFADFKDNGEFAVKGRAQSNTQVFAVKSLLNGSEIFKNVRIKYASKIKQAGKTMVEFYIYGKRGGSGVSHSPVIK